MATTPRPRSMHWIPVALALLAGTISCDLSGGTPAAQVEVAEPTVTIEPILPTPTEPTAATIKGPEGMVLSLEGEALTMDAEVSLEVISQTDLSTQGTPFEVVGPEYLVNFGEGKQVGWIVLTVPFDQTAKVAAPAAGHAYAAWARPDEGPSSMVGVVIEHGTASMPVVGAGRYQIVQIFSPEALAMETVVLQPLAVPSYPQMSCGWCSTTTLTDVAGYHEGAWPSGGDGGVWGESSQWYLAGLGEQGCDVGFFFHWLLKAGGYTTPEDVKQSFTNGNAEVIIWNWKGFKINPIVLTYYEATGTPYPAYIAAQLLYAEQLFSFFHAYVEVNVWGQNGGRRPVAWGSSLAHHSRAITGSDGENLFYNDPGSGSLNYSKSWEIYRQEVMASLTEEKTEVIDTAVFYVEARPASERRGVLWLTQWSEDREGSLVLRRGATGSPAAYWHWDGAGAHDYGYYFGDQIGDLPTDPTFDVQFKAFTADDVVEYGFAVRSISDAGHDFLVQTALFSETGEVPTISLPDRTATVSAGGRADIYPAGSFEIGGLTPGLYHLKFTLSQGGVVQDVKYVFFRLAERGYIPQSPTGTLMQNALCRKGPGTTYGAVTGFEAGRRLRLVGVDVERRWGKFEAEVSGNKFQCWISLSLVELEGDTNVPVFAAPPTEAAPALTATPTEVAPVCQRDVSREVCTATGGTWKYTLAGLGYCDCP